MFEPGTFLQSIGSPGIEVTPPASLAILNQVASSAHHACGKWTKPPHLPNSSAENMYSQVAEEILPESLSQSRVLASVMPSVSGGLHRHRLPFSSIIPSCMRKNPLSGCRSFVIGEQLYVRLRRHLDAPLPMCCQVASAQIPVEPPVNQVHIAGVPFNDAPQVLR